MKHIIELEVSDDIDLEHMLESVSDAAFFAENVTAKEQELVILFIQKLIKYKTNDCKV